MTSTYAPPERRVPRLGGFSLTFLALELRRMARNRRTMIFTFIMPSVFFLLFGTNSDSRHQRAGHGNVTAYILVSMAVYGAMLATTSGGASVSVERSVGWSRQLRLTPLNPLAYILVKVLVAMSLGLAAVLVVNVVGSFFGVDMPVHIWVECAVIGWLCSIVFAAFGLFMGYLLPSENVMQILGPVLALLSFAGGLFVPLDQMGHVFSSIAKFSPVYGVGVIARYPLTDDGNLLAGIVSVLVWTAVFVAGAAWRFRRDTARV
jgi:ABC-2 type transport system permease protein